LDRLDAILMREKPAAVTQASVGRAAVQGMGGVGKTSLAVEYAHRYRSLYAGVCWCPAETRTGLLSALAGLAVTLGAATAEQGCRACPVSARESAVRLYDLPVSPRTNARAIARLRPRITDRDCARRPWQVRRFAWR